VLPRVIGHRGAGGCAPENTLAALRKAKELGCRWVEFDVRLTVDDRPVLLHDDSLDRTTDGRGKVSALPLAVVRRHDAGIRFGTAFAGERVPTLEEAIMLLAELNLGANIELKAVRGRESATGTAVAELLAQNYATLASKLLISSFKPAALAAAAARAPIIARGALFQAIPKNWREIAETLGCATINADHGRLCPAIAAVVRNAGYPLLAYTVNDPRRARTLFDWGVTSVFSDFPQRLHEDAAPGGRPHLGATDQVSAEAAGQGSVH
jgi:glycerophosphoryl diester phosphodiesterase